MRKVGMKYTTGMEIQHGCILLSNLCFTLLLTTTRNFYRVINQLKHLHTNQKLFARLGKQASVNFEYWTLKNFQIVSQSWVDKNKKADSQIKVILSGKLAFMLGLKKKMNQFSLKPIMIKNQILMMVILLPTDYLTKVMKQIFYRCIVTKWTQSNLEQFLFCGIIKLQVMKRCILQSIINVNYKLVIIINLAFK